MAPVEFTTTDEDIVNAQRNLSIRGVGIVFLVNGLLLGLFWTMCYRALGGTLSVQPEVVSRLAESGYTILAFACLGYILVMDMETVLKDGRDAARRITLDWLAWCLAPLAAYVGLSALALNLDLPEPRQAVVLEGVLTGALVFYGFFLTRRRYPAGAHR